MLAGSGTCTVSTLAQAGSAKPWLGVTAASGEGAKTAGTRANLLVVLLKALPLMSYALSLLQPEDPTVAVTMMEVMAAVARGVAVRSVSEAVDGLLTPLMRAYSDAFDRFQKSATVALPILADVWAEEKKAPTVLAYLSLVGTSEAGSGTMPSPASGDSAELKALKDRFAKLEKKQRGLAKQLSDVESDGEDGETPEQKKTRKNADKKARKKLRKAESQPVTPSAAAAAATARAEA
jgi:hypothetical protein